MKQKLLLLVSIAFFFAACNDKKKDDGTTVKTDDTTTTKNETYTLPDSATMMKAFMDYATPGPMHAMLAKANGEWNEELSFRMDPSKPPEKMSATCTNTMILNGLYQLSVHQGNMNGMPFEGHSTVGYDNIRKMFVSTWIDNMGSGVMYMTGTYDEATKTISLKGKSTDAVLGKEIDVRETMTMVDDNTQKMEMFTNGPDGKEMKSMEVTFTRKNK